MQAKFSEFVLPPGQIKTASNRAGSTAMLGAGGGALCRPLARQRTTYPQDMQPRL
jgi:hypothetical protein